jgi:hypothetical protein
MYASFNYINEIKMTMEQAKTCSHSGPCDADVLELSKEKAIARQIKKIDPIALAKELAEYGAWNAYELANHEQNIQRILWIAAGNIVDGK